MSSLARRLDALEAAAAVPDPAPPAAPADLTGEALRKLSPEELYQVWWGIVRAPAPPRRPEDDALDRELAKLSNEELARRHRDALGVKEDDSRIIAVTGSHKVGCERPEMKRPAGGSG